MRSHPPTLETLVRRTVTDECLISPGTRILAAVSGGPDSMAMLHVLARLRGTLDFELLAHGVDHGLREEAGRELDLAADVAKSLDVGFDRTCVRVPRGGNLQARARLERYAALRSAAGRERASCIATAHHADDRAETVLLRLLRGASVAGLAVLPPSHGDLVRPLVRARRRDVDAHLARHDVPFATDPSNLDTRFLRARVRHELLPLLTLLSPGIVEHLNGLADDAIRGRDPGGDPLAAPLPRATREALANLAKSKSTRARVRLPGGLVATFEGLPGK